MLATLDASLYLQWLAVRYAFNNLDLIHAAVGIAKKEGVLVSMDLASFEVKHQIVLLFSLSFAHASWWLKTSTLYKCELKLSYLCIH